jgi:radical SAM protein with 4Fe4S-binding SPASM domain
MTHMASSFIQNLSRSLGAVLRRYIVASRALPQQEGQRCHAYGLYGLEVYDGKKYQWTRKYFGFYLEPQVRLITLTFFAPLAARLSAFISATPLDTRELSPGPGTVSFEIPPLADAPLTEISFRLDRAWKVPQDRRKLGIQIFDLFISDSSKATHYPPATLDCNATKQDWTRCARAFEVEGHSGRERTERNGNLNIQERTNGVDRVESTPTKLYLEIAWLCALRCPSCFHTYVPAEQRKGAIHFMSPFLFQRVVGALFSGALMVWYNGNGESLLHPNIDTILRSALEFKFIPALLTSGSLFNERNMRMLVEGGFFLSISVESPYEKDFERLRAGARFSKLIAAIEYLRELNRSINNRRFDIRIQCVAQRSNIHQLSDLVEWAARFGVEDVQFLPLQNFGMPQTYLEEAKLQRIPKTANSQMLAAVRMGTRLGVRVRPFPPFDPDEALGREFQSAIEENLSKPIKADQYYHQIAGIAEAPSNNPERDCYLAWSECFIGADGKVAPCDMYLDVTTVGNLYDDDFWDIWNSRQMTLMRKTVNTHPVELCRFGTCMFRPALPSRQIAGLAVGDRVSPSVDQVRQEGATVFVVGAGFTQRTVINLFFKRGEADVNLGGLDSKGTPLIPIFVETPTMLSFTVPVNALPGPSYVQAVNPPYSGSFNSGTGPGGSFVLLSC